MTTNRARKLLGKSATNLSEDQVKGVMSKVKYLAEVIYEDIEKSGIPTDLKLFNNQKELNYSS